MFETSLESGRHPQGGAFLFAARRKRRAMP
jgi:hypothetical protein